MKCPNCHRQITYRDFEEFAGDETKRRAAIELRSCRCKDPEHQKVRWCRECCPFDDPKAGPEFALEIAQGKRKPRALTSGKASHK